MFRKAKLKNATVLVLIVSLLFGNYCLQKKKVFRKVE